jgi:hypothetical protein
VQTFLPFEDFTLTASILDRRRLGNQRVECKQILLALHKGGGWKNHPAVKMWRGHSQYLIKYYYTIVEEWKRRGYKHNMMLDPSAFEMAKGEPDSPYWLGTPTFHERHRAMLVYKDPAHYKPIFSKLARSFAYYQPVDIPGYYWPPPLELPVPVEAEQVFLV